MHLVAAAQREAKAPPEQAACSPNGAGDLIEGLPSRLSSCKSTVSGVVTRLLVFPSLIVSVFLSQQDASPPPSSFSHKPVAPPRDEGSDVMAGVRQLFEALPPANLHESPVLVRLLPMHGHVKTTCRWFARTTRITQTWEVIRDAMRQGARLLISPSGQEVARDMTLGEMVVVGNQLTLELRWSVVGGGEEEDDELSAAAKRGNKSEVVTALSRGANVNTKDHFGYTPLIGAAIQGHLEVVQVLLAAGADVNAKDNNEYTALINAVIYGHLEMVQVLLAAGADVNAKGKNEYTALIHAVIYGHLEMVQVLLAAGAEVNAKSLSWTTALIHAASEGNLEVVQVLLAAGADVNAKDNNEYTALIHAVIHGALEMVQVLLAAGADVNAKGKNGCTPLICAVYHALEMVQVLLAAGADVNAKDNAGNSALDLAKKYGYTAIVAAMERQSDPLTKSASQGCAADADQ